MPHDELGLSMLPHQAEALPPRRPLEPVAHDPMPSAPPTPERRSYMIGPLEFAPEDLCVSVAGKRVWLTRRELEVLEVLAQSAGRPVARDEVHRRVWGGRVAGFKDRSVEVYIRRLRVKLAAAGPDWEHIHTHHNIGYRLDPEPWAAARERRRR